MPSILQKQKRPLEGTFMGRGSSLGQFYAFIDIWGLVELRIVSAQDRKLNGLHSGKTGKCIKIQGPQVRARRKRSSGPTIAVSKKVN